MYDEGALIFRVKIVIEINIQMRNAYEKHHIEGIQLAT